LRLAACFRRGEEFVLLKGKERLVMRRERLDFGGQLFYSLEYVPKGSGFLFLPRAEILYAYRRN